jgi:hypothetical protein
MSGKIKIVISLNSDIMGIYVSYDGGTDEQYPEEARPDSAIIEITNASWPTP